MGAIGTWDIRGKGKHWSCYKTDFGGLVMQMQKVISSCERCIQHEGALVKAQLQAILVISPLELISPSLR